VLVAHEDVGTLRIIRETLGQFGECEVDTSPTAEYAYELALQRDYALFMFGLGLPVLHGELLYQLLAKAYPFSHSGAQVCPGVVYIADKHEAGRAEALQREARVKGVLVKPLAIDRILARVKGTITLREDGATFS
jgi:DNA-binding response OmpR family regulator